MSGRASFADIAPWLSLALFAFTFFWCLIIFVISRTSGWAALAAAYPASDVLTPSTRIAWQSARMNANTKYNGALTIEADPEAVRFSVMPLMRVGHDPFAVPWRDLKAEARQLVFARRIALTFARVPGVTMLISETLAARLAAASAGRFAAPGSP